VYRRALTLAAIVALASGCGGGGADDEPSTITVAKPPGATGVKTTVLATLTSAKVSGGGSPGSAGTAVVELKPGAGTACWRLSVKGLDKPISAHVHEAPAGALGPVTIPLGDRFAAKGCVLVPRRSLVAVAEAPGDYYVDVHTEKYLDGAIRGQLRPSAG
jgi:hypothetical protein